MPLYTAETGLKANRRATLFSAALPGWSAALAAVKAGTADAILGMVGDSLTRGAGSNGPTNSNAAGVDSIGTTYNPKSYPHQMVALFNAAGIPARCDAVVGTGNPNFSTAQFVAATPSMSLGAGWVFGANPALSGKYFANSADLTALTFTPEIAADSFYIVYNTNTTQGASISVSDSSGVLGTYNGQTGSSSVQIKLITRATASTLPISIVKTGTVTNVAIILAIIPFNTTARSLIILNMGVSGWTTADWKVATATYSPFNALSKLLCNLVMVELGANDANGGVSAATFQTNLQNIGTQARTMTTAPDLLYVKTNRGNGHAQTGTDIPDAYITAIEAAAAAMGTSPPLDYNTTLSLVLGDRYDGIHLVESGYGKKAAYGAQALRALAGF